jgi:hypothetical protein
MQKLKNFPSISNAIKDNKLPCDVIKKQKRFLIRYVKETSCSLMKRSAIKIDFIDELSCT